MSLFGGLEEALDLDESHRAEGHAAGELDGEKLGHLEGLQLGRGEGFKLGKRPIHSHILISCVRARTHTRTHARKHARTHAHANKHKFGAQIWRPPVLCPKRMRDRSVVHRVARCLSVCARLGAQHAACVLRRHRRCSCSTPTGA